MDNIHEFIKSTFGIQFVLQYIAGKVIDEIKQKVVRCTDESELLYQLFDDSLKEMCEKMKWEYDSTAVYEELCKNDLDLSNLDNRYNAEEFLLKLVGNESYDEKILDIWYDCLKSKLKDDKYNLIFKDYTLLNFAEIKTEMGSILDYIKKVTPQEKNDGWEEREKNNEKKKYEEQFQLALQEIEDENYQKAIELLKNIRVWNKADRLIRYLCAYKIGFCYSQIACDLDGLERAIKWFEKAEEISNSEDDRVLLYRNIALLYICLGEKEDKIKNYKKSNLNLYKSLEYLGEDDDFYMNDIIIHIARNHMDMCDELPLNEVNENLDIAEKLMLGICEKNSGLSEEQIFILIHNLARLYYHRAEKNGLYDYNTLARECYISLLKLNYTTSYPAEAALVNNNIGLTYLAGYSNDSENINRAIKHFEIAEKLYMSQSKQKYNSEIWNIRLNIASSYGTLYKINECENDFNKANELIDDIIKNVKYNLNNSLILRTYILRLSIIIKRTKICGIDKFDFKEADDICVELESLFVQVNYEKYYYTFRILKLELELLRLKYGYNIEKEKIMKIKEDIIVIRDETAQGNMNISQNAEELLEEYVEVFE